MVLVFLCSKHEYMTQEKLGRSVLLFLSKLFKLTNVFTLLPILSYNPLIIRLPSVLKTFSECILCIGWLFHRAPSYKYRLNFVHLFFCQCLHQVINVITLDILQSKAMNLKYAEYDNIKTRVPCLLSISRKY